MVGTTSTTTTTTNTNMESIEIGCQNCGIHFDTREAQRDHMRGDWHVHNLKRKMSSLPPISHSEYDSRFLTAIKLEPDSQSSSESEGPESGSEDEEPFSPSQCLFCTTLSPSTSDNLSHMTLTHNFNIPDLQHLLDIDSFLGYLSTIINTFHECINCGSVKNSGEAVRDHMRGIGHCSLELEEDGLESGDFWEDSEDEEEEGESVDKEGEKIEGKVKIEDVKLVLVDGELRLPSGKILGRKTRTKGSRRRSTALSRSRSSSPPEHIEHQSQSPPKSSSAAPAPAPAPKTSSEISTVRTKPRVEHRIIPRPGTQTSLIGLSEVQQRALRATEMRIEKVETKAKKIYEAKVDRKGNKQKTFRVLSIGKKAGGLEKRNG